MDEFQNEQSQETLSQIQKTVWMLPPSGCVNTKLWNVLEIWNAQTASCDGLAKGPLLNVCYDHIAWNSQNTWTVLKARRSQNLKIYVLVSCLQILASFCSVLVGHDRVDPLLKRLVFCLDTLQSYLHKSHNFQMNVHYIIYIL